MTEATEKAVTDIHVPTVTLTAEQANNVITIINRAIKGEALCQNVQDHMAVAEVVTLLSDVNK